MFAPESLEAAPGERRTALLAPPFPDSEKQREFTLIQRPEIDGILRQLTQRCEFGLRKPAGRAQRENIDQVRISGKGAEALVGGVTVPGRSKRTRLPVAEPRGLEEAQQRLYRFTQRPDTLGAR